MHHKFFAHKLPPTRVRNGALVVSGMTRVGWLRRMCQHRFGRRQVVGEVKQVEQVASPVSQLAAAGLPKSAPTPRGEVLAVGERRSEGAIPEVPVEIFGDWLGLRIGAPGIGEVVPAGDAAGPNPGFDWTAE